jgi:hypothetical protein
MSGTLPAEIWLTVVEELITDIGDQAAFEHLSPVRGDVTFVLIIFFVN